MCLCATGDLLDKVSLDYFAIISQLEQSSKSKLAQPNTKSATASLDDVISNVHLADNADRQVWFRQLTRNLELQLGSLSRPIGPLSAKLLDLKSFLRQDVRLSLSVIDYFRSYYGAFHPRLAVKLLVTAYQLRHRPNDQLIRVKMLEEAQQIAIRIVPSLQDMRSEKTNTTRQLQKLNDTFLGQVERELFVAKTQMQSERVQVQANRSRVSTSLHLPKGIRSRSVTLTHMSPTPRPILSAGDLGLLASRSILSSRLMTRIHF
jgi:hypothetical protein